MYLVPAVASFLEKILIMEYDVGSINAERHSRTTLFNSIRLEILLDFMLIKRNVFL